METSEKTSLTNLSSQDESEEETDLDRNGEKKGIEEEWLADNETNSFISDSGINYIIQSSFCLKD